MNKFYKVVFCKTTGLMKAVSETAKSGKKTKSVSVAAGVLAAGIAFTSPAFADSAVGDPILSGEVTGQNSIAVGETNTIADNSDGAGSLNNTATGVDNSVKGSYSTAVGNENDTDGWRVTAVGKENIAKGLDQTAVGSANYIGNANGFDGFGNPYQYETYNSTAIGAQNSIFGTESSAFGSQNEVYGTHSVAVGDNNYIYGDYEPSYANTAVGTSNSTDGDYNTVLGRQNSADTDSATITGGENYVSFSESGAYGQNNTVGLGGNSSNERAFASVFNDGVQPLMIGDGVVQPTAFASQSRVLVPFGESYAYGNRNNISRSQTHAVGNRNSVTSDFSGVLGSDNNVSSFGNNGGVLIPNEPTFQFASALALDDSEGGVIGENSENGSWVVLDGEPTWIPSEYNNEIVNDFSVPVIYTRDSTGNFVIGNTNNVAGDNSHTLGNANLVNNNRNVTIGNSNTVDFLEEGGGSNQWNLRGVGFNQNTSTAIIGDTNSLTAAGGHILGTENIVTQKNTYVVGARNTVFENSSMGMGFNPNDSVGSNVTGSHNTIQDSSVTVSGDYNTILDGSKVATVSGYMNQLQGGLGTVVGTYNIIEKDGGGVVGTGNQVYGVHGIDAAIERSFFNNDGDAIGIIDVDGDGVADFSNEEEAFMAKITQGSYAHGNMNGIDGNAVHIVGNQNAVVGDRSGSFGNNNKIGSSAKILDPNGSEQEPVANYPQMFVNSDGMVVDGEGFSIENMSVSMDFETGQRFVLNDDGEVMEGWYVNSDGMVIPPETGMIPELNATKYDDTFAYGNDNVVDAETTSVMGLENTVIGANSSVVGNYNSVEGFDNLVLGNDNTATFESSTIVGSNNDATGEYVFIGGGYNDVSGYESGAVGDSNTISNAEGLVEQSYAFGNRNAIESNNTFIVGNDSTVNDLAEGSLIFGSRANSSVANGVAIGNDSTVDRENTVSFGTSGAARQLTNVAAATELTDAVNLEQLNASLRDTTGGKNITATQTDTGYNVSLNQDVNLSSITTGDTLVNTDGVRAGAVFLSSTTGLDNAGNRVTSVGDALEATDAVNLKQLNASLRDTTGDENITATQTDTGYNVALNRNVDLDNVTTGLTSMSSNGITAGSVVLSSTTGLNNAGYRVSGVGDAINQDDAVNLKQLGESLRDTTGSKNITATRTDTGYQVFLNEDVDLASVTTGATTVSTAGIKAGDVTLSSTTGLDNAGNRVTNVGDAVEVTDAVNLKQLNASLRDTTGDENITATQTDTGYNVALNRNVDLDNVTTGLTSMSSNGITAGSVVLSSTTGLNNAGYRVSGVGDAINQDDAVNLKQLNASLRDTTGDENITATQTDTGYNVALNRNVDLDNVTTGATTVSTAGIKAGDVTLSSSTGLDNAGNRVTNVGDAVEVTDAVNLKQLNASLRDTTGDENITATQTDTGYNVALNRNVDLDSVTTGATSFNNDGVRAGSVVLSSTTGLNNAGYRVSGVGDAINRDDAVNFGQFTDGLNGLTKTTIAGDQNVVAVKNETGYDLSLNKDLVGDSLTTGATTVSTAGIKAGDVTLSSSTGLDNAGNRVTNVGDAVEVTDAVNLKQLNASLRDTTGDENITATQTATGYNVSLNKAVNVDSVTTGATSFNTDGVRAGNVVLSSTTGLDNAGNRVTNVGDAVEVTDAVNLKQLNASLRDTTGDENITATQTDTGYNVSLNRDIDLDSIKLGDALLDSTGMNIGNSFFGETGIRTGEVTLSNTAGLYNAGYRVTGVGRAVEGMDAVNFDQFNEALGNIKHTTVAGDGNIIATKNDTGYDLALNKDLTADSLTTGSTTVNDSGVQTGSVTVSSNGLNNGGNRVTNIGDAVEGSDAVSFDQFNKAINGIAPTTINGDSNILVSKGDDGAFNLNLNKDLTADSVTVGNTSITNDGLKVGNVTVGANGLNNGGNTVSGVGKAVNVDDAVNLGQLDDVKNQLVAENQAQNIVINNKVDRAEFKKDQARQEELMEAKADKTDLAKTNVNVSNNTTNIGKNTDTLKEHTTELGRLEDVKADKAELEAKADVAYVDKENASQNSYYNERFSELNKESSEKMESFTKSQTSIDSSQNVRIGKQEEAIVDLGYKMGDLEDKLSAGIASTVALASMPSAFKNGEARLAGGFGYYNGQNAIAIGLTGATETGEYSYKIGSSYTKEGGAVVGAGISYRVW